MPPESPASPAAVQSKIANPKSKMHLHLSTCVILLFAAGALLGANMYPQRHIVKLHAPGGGMLVSPQAYATNYGWPFACKIHLTQVNAETVEWFLDNLFFDVLAALAILTTIAWLCELRIRRWEPRRARASHFPSP